MLQLQQMMRQSHQAADADDDDDESDDDDDDADDTGLRYTADNLKVFCCSSTEFLKLSGKLTKDGPAQVGMPSKSDVWCIHQTSDFCLPALSVCDHLSWHMCVSVWIHYLVKF